MLLAAGTGILCHVFLGSDYDLASPVHILLLVGSLLVAVWPKVPRLFVYSDGFVVRGFLEGGYKKYDWKTVQAVKSRGRPVTAGFIVLTTEGRVRIRGSFAGVTELYRIFEKMACDSEHSSLNLADAYRDEEGPIVLRKNWQMGIGPAFALAISSWLLITMDKSTSASAWFWYILLGAGAVGGAIYSFRILVSPFTIRLTGTTLKIVGIARREEWDLRQIVSIDVLEPSDSEELRMCIDTGETVKIRLKDLFGYPVFDRAFWSIYFRWEMYRGNQQEIREGNKIGTVTIYCIRFCPVRSSPHGTTDANRRPRGSPSRHAAGRGCTGASEFTHPRSRVKEGINKWLLSPFIRSSPRPSPRQQRPRTP
jgi:hypothetical protein